MAVGWLSGCAGPVNICTGDVNTTLSDGFGLRVFGAGGGGDGEQAAMADL